MDEAGELLGKRFTPEPNSAPGDFYVENECCTSCGVPQAVAPDLVGWVEGERGHCFWKKQPESYYELTQAFRVLQEQELGCHRYAGSDPHIQRRVGLENCDQPDTGFWRGGAEKFSKMFWKWMSKRRW